MLTEFQKEVAVAGKSKKDEKRDKKGDEAARRLVAPVGQAGR
jgi:hypothetical protein